MAPVQLPRGVEAPAAAVLPSKRPPAAGAAVPPKRPRKMAQQQAAAVPAVPGAQQLNGERLKKQREQQGLQQAQQRQAGGAGLRQQQRQPGLEPSLHSHGPREEWEAGTESDDSLLGRGRKRPATRRAKKQQADVRLPPRLCMLPAGTWGCRCCLMAGPLRSNPVREGLQVHAAHHTIPDGSSSTL